MDFFLPDTRGRRFHLVYKQDVRVLEDYLQSLALFDRVIELEAFDSAEFLQSNDIYVFTQMWLPASENPELVAHPRFVYLNVENLTERNRCDHVRALLDHGARIADYSLANIALLEADARDRGVALRQPILHFPYQAHPHDFVQLFNSEHRYDYDVGMINACVEPDLESNAKGLVYRRNAFWRELQRQSDIRSINVMGWGAERDAITRRCRIIVNVHHFDCFRIFQHIRCDRLVFANKLVLSEHALLHDRLDLAPLILFCAYEQLLDTLRQALHQFEPLQQQLESMPKQPLIAARRQAFQATLDGLLQDIEASGP